MRSRIKHLSSCFLALGVMAFVATLASCNKDEAIDDRLPDGKYPITFTVTTEELTVEKAATRATTDGTWDGDEEVAVKIGSEVKKYQAAADGTLTATNFNDALYWKSTTMDVEAWYSTSYKNKKPTSFTVQEDQSGNGYQSSDMLYASQSITFNKTPPSLTFRHLPVKVVVNLKAGVGITTDKVTNATVSIVNQNLQSGPIDPDWSVSQITTTGQSAITPNELSTPTAGYQRTLQALLVPQKSTESTKFIKVTIDQQDYYYSTTLNFATAKQYTFTITVNKDGITVTAS